MHDENMEFIFLMIALDCGPVGYTYPCLKVIALRRVCLSKMSISSRPLALRLTKGRYLSLSVFRICLEWWPGMGCNT